MIHLGDITKIDGHNVPTTDVVVGGSPCQDLSVAGLRKGLAGERSGLYMDQIRVVKEMREADVLRGRADVDIRPRYMVWENVPGSFSSNGGKDYAAVLEEVIRVAEPEAPALSVPQKGWPTSGCVYDEMGRWSVAWRVLDAQYWGVPQRRRRICLVADFNGLNAPKIVFGEVEHNGSTGQVGRKQAVRHTGNESGREVQPIAQSVSRNIDESGTAGKEASGDVGTGTNGTSGGDQDLVKAVGFPLGLRPENVRVYDEVATTLCNGTRPGFTTGVVMQTAADRLVLDDQGGQQISVREDGKSPTLRAETHGNLPCVMRQGFAMQALGKYIESDVASAMKARDHKDATDLIIDGSTKYLVRRLTPLECERLQGYPDGWTLIGDPVEEDVADYETVFDESKYVEPKPEDFGLTAEDVENIMRIEDDTRERDDDDIDPEEYGDERYNEYLRAVDKAKAKATKRIKVGSHKEVNYYYTDCSGKRKKVCDSQRYKALGNSIALPPWKWIMKRICACYERDATLASLFDGIGGFPLIWEQINGKGSCLWASEIEEFPMAVTRARFGDE